MTQRSSTLENNVSTLQGITTVFVLIAGLAWFIQRDEAAERVNIKHHVAHRQ